MATREEVSNGYDEKTKLPPEWKDWPTAPKAAALVGVSIRTLTRRVSEGVITRHQAPDNTYRYNPSELEDCKEYIRGSNEDQEMVVAEGFKSGTELVKQSHKHSEEMFRLYATPIHELLDMYRGELKVLRERVVQLEATRDDLANKREELISEQHIREVLTAKVLKSEERKEKAFGMVLAKVPGVFDKFIESHLGQSVQVKATVELLKGFDKESLAMLLETEILTEEQKAHVRTILGMPQPVPKVKPDASEEPPVETTGEEKKD